GCILARLANTNVDVRLPYVNQGDDAYNGRTLDERVVNTSLRSRKIPCTKGPFLSVFRRSVKLDESTREGVRDKQGFDSLLSVIDYLRKCGKAKAKELLLYHAFRFVLFRERSGVPIIKLKRISLEQLDDLIRQLLSVKSGGRFALYLAVSAFETLRDTLSLPWTVDHQGINVSDKASGASGDIMIRYKGEVILAAEITERVVDEQRVMATFDTKIAAKNIEEYLFLSSDGTQHAQARKLAQRYFSQGHEISFLDIRLWIVNVLSIVGSKGRSAFVDKMASRIGCVDVSSVLKIAWNEAISSLAHRPRGHKYG
ncbi:MAG: restriction endonuclease, SacI family, partial [Candidatus Hydrogenedentota bacterium]